MLCVRCWDCRWVVSLLYLTGSRQAGYWYSSALIFGWLDMIPVLKGNGINKKPNNDYIDFWVTISKWYIINASKSRNLWRVDWNERYLAHEFLRESSWCFIFYVISFDFALSSSAFAFWFYFFKNRPEVPLLTLTEGYLEPSWTSMMELFLRKYLTAEI